MMSDDEHKESDGLCPECLMKLLDEAEFEPVDIDILAMMAVVKAQLQAARENPCFETITSAVNSHGQFLDDLLEQEPFDQYLLATHIGRFLPREWRLWVNYTRNYHERNDSWLE